MDVVSLQPYVPFGFTLCVQLETTKNGGGASGQVRAPPPLSRGTLSLLLKPWEPLAHKLTQSYPLAYAFTQSSKALEYKEDQFQVTTVLNQ